MTYIAEPDLMVRVVASPLHDDEISVLRVRAQPYIPAAAVHISIDGHSYSLLAHRVPAVVGFNLIEPLRDPRTELPLGPLLVVRGPDASILRVLSDEDWRLGRQLFLVGDEWCFVREFVAYGGDRIRAVGILRGQFETEVQEHEIGTPCFAMPHWLLPSMKDLAVSAKKTLKVKIQPYTDEPISLADIKPVLYRGRT